MAHLHQSLCVTSKIQNRKRERRKGGKKGRCLQRSSIQPNLQKQNFPEMPFCNPKRSHLHQRIQLGITNLCGLLGFVWLSQSEFFRERKQEKEPLSFSLLSLSSFSLPPPHPLFLYLPLHICLPFLLSLSLLSLFSIWGVYSSLCLGSPNEEDEEGLCGFFSFCI